MDTKHTPRNPEPETDLDQLLEAAYGSAHESDPGSSDTKSVLEELRKTAGKLPNVHLREIQDERMTPVTVSVAGESRRSERLGRYQLLDEVGRGGVGVIHRVHDVDLGRDLAIKVLLERHCGKADITRRFIEEAQIAGQLQHPGVVPIHELGLFGPDRPYFAMKLVKGRTLSALLNERTDPEDGRQRLLGVFEKVCQTIAYANAKGVIHRDLKPSNIMVGTFGEVQVMDWGLAKVLTGRRDDNRSAKSPGRESVVQIPGASAQVASVPGVVMGTPAYMAPEQARGQVDELDERCDVFGLGAILCEILTGHPPHTGRDTLEVQLKAQEGDITDARRRLEALDCDEELVSLAVGCLAAEPDGRPPNAGVVADRVAAYLASFEERARQSALLAAEARVKARAEAKARRLTVGLAAAVLLGFVLAAFLLMRLEARKHDERARANHHVTSVLDHAKTLWRQAESSSVFARSEWDSALQTSMQARTLVTDLVDDQVKEQADQLVEQITAAKERAEESFQRTHKRVELTRRLEELRLEHGDDSEWHLKEPPYRDAFRDFGIDVDSLSIDDAVAAIRESELADRIAPALDDWARARRRVRGSEAEGWRHLARIAKLIDPDSLRGRLRDAFLNDDSLELQRLARSRPFMTSAPPSTLTLLYSSLLARDAREDAWQVCLRAWERYKDDFWLNHDMANFMLREPRLSYEGAHRHFLTAVALRPESPHALREYAQLLRIVGDLSISTAVYEKANRLDEHSLRRRERGLSAQVERGEYSRLQLVPFFGPPGDVAFDPGDDDTLYVVEDDLIRRGGGVYRLDRRGGVYSKGEKLVELDEPSSIAFDGSGDLWVARDVSNALSPHVLVIRQPRARESVSIRSVIHGFGGPGDDDPSIIRIAPKGFSGQKVAPGDVIIGDGGVDAGFGAHSPGVSQALAKGFYAYSPDGLRDEPAVAYNRFLTSPDQLRAYSHVHLRDFEFSKDGKELYALFESGRIVRINPDGKVIREIEIQGDLLFSTTMALAVNPDDGRIWMADDFRDQIWSIDPEGGHARLEISFFKEGESRLDLQVELSEATMRFSPDGGRLVVSDHGSGGWLWIFERKEAGWNNPPTARIVTDPPIRTLALRDGEARIALDGSASDDGDHGEQRLAFEWTNVSGPGGDTIETPREPLTAVRLARPGKHVYALTVSDGQKDNATHVVQVVVDVLAVSVELAEDSTFTGYQRMPFAGRPKDVAFDPADADVFYAIHDDTIKRGGGIYQFDRRGTSFHKGPRLVAEGRLSSLTLAPDGSLWFVQEFTSQRRAYLMVAQRDHRTPPFDPEPVIWNFGAREDDDPFVLAVVPAGFEGLVSPGDILIGDRRVDFGGRGRRRCAIYRFNPSTPPERPDAYGDMLLTPETIGKHNAGALVDFDFAPDGSALYALLGRGRVLVIDPRGKVVDDVDVSALAPDAEGASRWRGLAVDPTDGRVWVMDGGNDRVLSFDASSKKSGARVEITYRTESQYEGILFPVPTLRFSPDGRRLIVCEAGNGGWLWLFERD